MDSIRFEKFEINYFKICIKSFSIYKPSQSTKYLNHTYLPTYQHTKLPTDSISYLKYASHPHRYIRTCLRPSLPP